MTTTTASTSTEIAVPEPVFTAQERLVLAGFLAGHTGLTREAYALDLRQFTAWCQLHHLRLFQARRADIECFARDLEARGRARATITRRLCTIAGYAGRPRAMGRCDDLPVHADMFWDHRCGESTERAGQAVRPGPHRPPGNIQRAGHPDTTSGSAGCMPPCTGVLCGQPLTSSGAPGPMTPSSTSGQGSSRRAMAGMRRLQLPRITWPITLLLPALPTLGRRS